MLAGIETDGARAVCVDRGLAHCLAAALEPTLLVGDLDSLPRTLLERDDLDALPRLVFAPDKDASDLELALRWLAGETSPAAAARAPLGGDAPLPDELPDEVIVVGVSGGRTDHLLFNWLLPLAREWPFALRLIDATVDAVVVTPTRALDAPIEPGRVVSVLPLSRATGLRTGGLRYALDDATLERGTTRGLSNVADARRLTLSLERGIVLVLRGRAALEDAADGAAERG